MWKNPALGATAQPVQIVGWLWVHLAPNCQGYGHKGHHVTACSTEKGQGSKGECAMDKWRCVITVQIKYKTVCTPTVVVVPTAWSYGYGRATGGSYKKAIQQTIGGRTYSNVVTWYTHRTGGRGYGQARSVPQHSTYFNSNIIFTIYITRDIWWRAGWAALPKSLPLPGGRGVNSGQQHNFKPMYI
jgi:hypothetical protein